MKNSQNQCLGCGSRLPQPFLDLGATPLANSYIKPQEAGLAEDRFPLAVAYCESCHLVQLTHLVPPERLFGEYLYFTSYSDSFLRHAEEMSRTLIGKFALEANSLVVEIASNDGYLLQYFQRERIPVLGVEPARNIAEHANSRGIRTLNRFFDETTAGEIVPQFGRADVLIGNNVLAHVPNINGFLRGVKHCLKDTGVAVFEFPYVADLLDKNEFDTIYHEHVFYFSLGAIDELARRSGLELFEVDHQAVHGGSLRVFLQQPGRRAITASIGHMLAAEQAAGLLDSRVYSEFGSKAASIKAQLLEMLGGFRRQGFRLAAYGAPAKGNTLLNYCGIDSGLIDFTVDRSPHKQGLLLPGSRIPILPPHALLERRPDYTLILPWNIADEIVGQQAAYLAAGGHFLVAVPRPRVLS